MYDVRICLTLARAFHPVRVARSCCDDFASDTMSRDLLNARRSTNSSAFCCFIHVTCIESKDVKSLTILPSITSCKYASPMSL